MAKSPPDQETRDASASSATGTASPRSKFCDRGMRSRRSRHSPAVHSSNAIGIAGWRRSDQKLDQRASSGPHRLPSAPHSQTDDLSSRTGFTWKCRCGGVVRAAVAAVYGEEVAQAMRILYGGSVNAKNIAEIMQQLPPGISLTYTGLSYEEIQTGDQAPMLYALTVLIVFLCLAALYESWSVPVSVMLVVPLGILGAVLATLWRDLTADVYFQIGLMTTVGLSAKNAILIVEFAKELYEKEGMPLVKAATEAAKLRLRPILMTSLAFTFGVLPMAIASGAGAGSQHSIATGVVGGMITATVLAVFFVPLFYVVVVKLFERNKKAADVEGESA